MASIQNTSQNTVFLPNIILDETNYSAWLFRMEFFLGSQNLMGFVDGSTPCPPQFVRSSDGTTTQLSQDYVNWKVQDQNIGHMIGQTLSKVATNAVVGSKCSFQMWENLKLKFASQNRQNILQLKSNLQNLRKGADDIETYLDKIKEARDALETVGVQVDDEDIVVTVLRGLPAEFAAIKTVIRAQFVSCSLRELKTLLKAAEIDIENESQSSIPLTAMVAHSHTQMPSLGASSSYSTPSSVQTQSCVPASSSVQPVMQCYSQPQMQSAFHAPQVPPGFSPVSTQNALTPMPPQVQTILQPNPQQSYATLIYGFDAMNNGDQNDNMNSFSGFYAGRGNPRPSFNNGGNNFNNGARNFGNNNFGPPGFNNNAGQGNTGFNNGGNNFNNGGSITCQFCNRPGHGARTCRTLLNLQNNNNMNYGNNGDNTNGRCIYCGRRNHTVERCYYIIGFPDRQQNNNAMRGNGNNAMFNGNNAMPNENSAMLAATHNAPQFWLANTGATNHMTSNGHSLNNLTPYSASDTVQIGQGVGQSSLQRSE